MVNRYRDRILEMEEDIKTIQMEEKEEREMRAVENQANKAQRLLENGDDDPKRGWFQTHRQRMEEKGEIYLFLKKIIKLYLFEIISLKYRVYFDKFVKFKINLVLLVNPCYLFLKS